MAKKIRNRPDPPAAGRQGDAGPAGRHRARPARDQHRRVLQDLQREDSGAVGPGHPGPDHDLRGPQLHLHPQDAAGGGPAAQGGRRREGLIGRPVARRSARSRAARCARSPRSRWLTSTPSTSTAQPRSSRAPLARWVSRSWAELQPRQHRTPRGTEGRLAPGSRQHGGMPRWPSHGKKYQAGGGARRARPRLPARPGDGPAQADQLRRASTHRPRRTSAWASIRATPTRWCAARSSCRTAPASAFA